MREGFAGKETNDCIVRAFRKVVAGFDLESQPHSSLAIRAEKSSERDKKIFVRNVCSSVAKIRPAART